MQFCKDCGNVLNLFDENDRELCPPCIHSINLKKAVKPRNYASEPQNNDVDLLGDCVLTIEGNKTVIRSKEGWELWSSPVGAKTELKDILSRAKRIYQIRLRRQRN